MEANVTTPTQRTYAKLAGAMCLLNYALDVCGQLTTARINGSGEISSRAQHILAFVHLYRTGLTELAVGWVIVVVIAFSQYVTLRPVDKRIAQLALLCRLGEALIGAVTVAFSFAAIQLYEASHAALFQKDQLQTLLSVLQSVSTNGFQIAMIFLGVGSTLFFCLFYKSRYIPRLLAGFGIFASAILLAVSLTWLVLPEFGTFLQYGWGPIGLAEVITALWLLLRGIRVPPEASSL